jgi:hypothetical protein
MRLADKRKADEEFAFRPKNRKRKKAVSGNLRQSGFGKQIK